MAKIHNIFIELYGFNLYFIKSSRSLYAEKIKEEFDLAPPDKNCNVLGTTEIYYREGTTICVLWLWNKADRSVLVHEVFHAVHYLMDDKGLCLTDASEEAYAYLIQYVYKKLEQVLFKR